VIIPRTTRLLRVPDLRALHKATADRASARTPEIPAAVILPTAGAAEELRKTLEALLPKDGSAHRIVLPELLTRTEFYTRLHSAIPDAPRMLTGFEREVLFRRCARRANDAGTPAPFRLRPGLIVQILDLYDQLRRRERTVADFARLMTGSLEPSADIDRGAERMLRQTRFLAAAFEDFERSIASTGCLDEHGLRERLLSGDGVSPFRRVVITVADQAADPHGLWSADYALLTRIAGLAAIDQVVTENVLASGFHERVHDLLPGIEEEKSGARGDPPVLAVPAATAGEEPVRWFVSRDREEELADVARLVTGRGGPDRLAVVFQRPLPYLYLAREVFTDAGIPYQALDALPLAAEPFAAAIDLVFAFVSSEATRGATVELLRSPHWTFDRLPDVGVEASLAQNSNHALGVAAAEEPAATRRISRQDVGALDALLRELKYVGGWDQLSIRAAQAREPTETGRRASQWRRAAAALQAANSAAAALRPVAEAPSASAQIAALRAFVRAHERLPSPSDAWYARHLRARAAVLGALDAMADAHARHDDEPMPIGDLFGTIRRWMEGETFAPRTGAGGLLLLEASSAAFADVDEVRLVGLVDTDWPDRAERSIFYPASLLAQLGWPADVARLSGARARFQDLLRLARTRVSLSAFTLEEDAIVSPSVLLDELELSGFPVEQVPPEATQRVFTHDALAGEPLAADAVAGDAAGWLALRRSRGSPDAPMFRGEVGIRPPEVYAVSHVERYLDCPFKYFAAYVLRLEEERDEEAGLTPQERGQFVHGVFERFFADWQASGRRAITTKNLPEALAMFSEVADAQLATLPDGDRSLERTHLLGSAAAPGLAERAFAFEIENGGDILERLLEHSLEGEFRFEGPDGARTVRLRAKADRIDLVADGTFRVIDYKLGRAPKPKRALQLSVYGACAEQHLEGRHGRHWTLGRAGYIAFREKNAFVELGGSAAQLPKSMAEGQARLLGAIEAIEAGTFPVRPDEPWLCTRCGFSMICRKDYVGDE
jgi:RecB family exonuclease